LISFISFVKYVIFISLMFQKILTANRGEIAVRVMRACRELGIGSVAVYSEADADALHVRTADEAYCIGPAQPIESYLNIEKILEVAKKSGAEAVHPGYGFLAENYEFAKACEDAGITFIGPNWKAMKLLGNKLESRRTMTEAGLPVIPGMHAGHSGTAKGASIKDIEAEARKIGFPVLVKAASGGGGKGMRIVKNAQDLPDALESAQRESKSAFGDDTVYIEKCLVQPRHVEFQILCDNYGNVIHLNERECSIQRRHQKIVEETPSPALDGDPAKRERMGEAAVKAAKSAGYTNAGTVEMLLDTEGNFYFLEVNARLQVEHPVTELTTGIDLVHEQIHIAAGEKLRFTQNDISRIGHAVEVRLYAEDPENDFLPSSGTIFFTKEPAGPGIRVDSGIYSGCNVPVYYDPILSKLIVWAHDRQTSIQRMKCALADYPILGVKNTGGFLTALMDNPAFQSGDLSTDFLERQAKYFKNWKENRAGIDDAAIAAALYEPRAAPGTTGGVFEQRKQFNPWISIGKWSIGSNEKK